MANIADMLRVEGTFEGEVDLDTAKRSLTLTRLVERTVWRRIHLTLRGSAVYAESPLWVGTKHASDSDRLSFIYHLSVEYAVKKWTRNISVDLPEIDKARSGKISVAEAVRKIRDKYPGVSLAMARSYVKGERSDLTETYSI